MSAWEDFLDDVFGHPNKPGKVMICFVNRYLEGMDDVKYKIKYDGHEKSGTTTAQHFCIELSPASFNPIHSFVWSRQAKAWKKLDDVVAVPGRKKLVRKMLKTFKVPAKTEPLPDASPTKPRPNQPAPAPAPAPSPAGDQGIKPDQGRNENGQPQARPERAVPGETTLAQLRKIFPKNHKGMPSDGHLQDVADELNKDLPKFKLDTSVRRAHFFGQVKQEAGPLLSGAPESFNYKASVLLAKFGYYKRHHDEAKTDGRAENSKTPLTTAQQKVIANKVYGSLGNLGVGNDKHQPNDGWDFRGRGIKQTTGRNNYKTFKDKHTELWGEQIDFIANPDKVSEMPYNVRSAVVFWVYNNCWQAADGGMNDSAIDAVTHIVNAGELSAYKKKPTTDSPVVNRRTYAKLAYAAFS
jgi:putative chitinase